MVFEDLTKELEYTTRQKKVSFYQVNPDDYKDNFVLVHAASGKLEPQAYIFD